MIELIAARRGQVRSGDLKLRNTVLITEGAQGETASTPGQVHLRGCPLEQLELPTANRATARVVVAMRNRNGRNGRHTLKTIDDDLRDDGRLSTSGHKLNNHVQDAHKMLFGERYCGLRCGLLIGR